MANLTRFEANRRFCSRYRAPAWNLNPERYLLIGRDTEETKEHYSYTFASLESLRHHLRTMIFLNQMVEGYHVFDLDLGKKLKTRVSLSIFVEGLDK